MITKLVDAVNWICTWTFMTIKGQGVSLTFVIQWPLSKVSQIQHFQTSFLKKKILHRLESYFMWSLHGMEERRWVQMLYFTWLTWPPCPYMLNFFFQKHLLWNRKANEFETWYAALSTRVLSSYSNDTPGLILTYFTARSNLVRYVFVRKKVKTMDFSEIVVVYDIKGGRCSN